MPSTPTNGNVRFPTTKLGEVAAEPPQRKRPLKYDWPTAVRLMQANPGQWVLVFKKFSTGMYSYVRKGGPPMLREIGGTLELSLTNQKVTGGTKAGELWVRWTPDNWTEQDQALSDAAREAGEGTI